MKVDETFAKVVGRPASDAERERLVRLGEALEVQDNDALWAIVMALELYDSLYREYPQRLAAETGKAIEGVRRAFADAAKLEAAKAQTNLARRVAQRSAELARARVGKPSVVPWVTAGGAAMVAFGALCVSAGAALERNGRPWWARRGGAAGWADHLGLVLAAPAGWMMLAFLLPVAAYIAWSGWQRLQLGTDARDVWGGGALVALSGLGAVACVVVLLEVL